MFCNLGPVPVKDMQNIPPSRESRRGGRGNVGDGTPKSDGIYHFPIDLEPNGCPFAVPNQSVHDKYNLISVWFHKISQCLHPFYFDCVVSDPKYN